MPPAVLDLLTPIFWHLVLPPLERAAAAALIAQIAPLLKLLAVLTIAAKIGVPIGVASLLGVGLGRLMEPWQRRRMERVLLGCGLCADCAYPIDSLDADDEGRTGCPECGGRWTLPPAPLAPAAPPTESAPAGEPSLGTPAPEAVPA